MPKLLTKLSLRIKGFIDYLLEEAKVNTCLYLLAIEVLPNSNRTVELYWTICDLLSVTLEYMATLNIVKPNKNVKKCTVRNVDMPEHYD